MCVSQVIISISPQTQFGFSHILQQPVKIDVGVLCHTLDLLCGSFIAAKSFELWKNSFHDLLLPRSWVADLVDGNSLFKDTATLELFVPVYRSLLGLLYMGGDGAGELELISRPLSL